ncbi:TRAFAC clade GTPase domain-containing protein [Hyphococcus sp.]|uniref:TRAFAC clade GTPase domain-containing protein n=1 Tax=Hyphococcus sp. TaxID=2038636 RepID=UPI003D0E03D0
MSDATSIFVCTNASCKYAESGRCVEGNELSECPHLKSIDQAVTEEDDQPQTDVEEHPESIEPALFHIGGESSLSVAAASRLMKCRKAPIIAFAGSAEAGKTCLIAEIYDALQYGKYDSLEFAGSDTLMAFEKICHRVRATSKAPDLSEPRTEFSEDPSFFHLRLALRDGNPLDLLLADRWGETYREVMDTPERAKNCLELMRADILNVLIDGERLCDPARRAAAASECHQLLQTLALSKCLPSVVRVNLILTKLDQVDVNHESARIHKEFNALLERVRNLNAIFAATDAHKIAARPKNEAHPKGYGVEGLISSWFGGSLSAAPYVPTALPHGARAFDMVRCGAPS